MPGIPPINLIGSVLFGDPAFNPTSLGSAGDYSNNAHGLMGQRDPYSTLLQGKILSWCNHEDLICQGSGLLNFALQTVKNCATIAALGCDIIGQINSHLNYPTAQWGGISEVAFTAQWLARQIAKAPNPYTSSSGGNTGTSGNTGWSETTGSVAHTWTNYLNAGGFEGPTISSNRTVVVACKVNGFRVSNGNTTWYRIAQFPWSNHYFVSADAFYNNGATSGSLHGTPPFDPTIVDC